MAYEPIFSIEGNLLNDPELRFTPTGTPVASFRVGINDARPEANNGKTDVHPLVAEVSVWREMAENAAETLVKGMRITAKVRMVELGAYTSNKGELIGTLKVEALEIGPSLRWATAKVAKVNRNGGNGGGQQGHGGGNQGNQGYQQGQQNRQGGGQQGGNNGGGQGGGWPNSGGGNQADPWATDGQQNAPAQGNGWGSDQSWGSTGNNNNGEAAWGK